ncbi:hypothetical protein H1Q63_15390 [Desmonostoc muscorum CCALA 125]|nr:hypothetical protein [Desmonostoc muscorum CCALA 125]
MVRQPKILVSFGSKNIFKQQKNFIKLPNGSQIPAVLQEKHKKARH